MKRRLWILAPVFALVALLLAAGGSGHGAASGAWHSVHYRVLYAFRGGNDGGVPIATLVRDSRGNLYGTTTHQTVQGSHYRLGNVFKLDSASILTVLHTFSGGDGGTPEGTLAADSSGRLYGTTSAFGGAGVGTVYRLDSSKHLKVLLDFRNANAGANPIAGVVLDAAGNLYGAAFDGGITGMGTVYELEPNGSVRVLHSFTGKPDGKYPEGGLLRLGSNAFFGTTSDGGTYGRGSLYLAFSQGFAKSGVTYSFRPAPDGRAPALGSLVRDSNGTTYGTTLYGGTSDKGTVFRLTASGVESVVHSFSGYPDGANPVGGVVVDNAGNVYGTTLRGGEGCGRWGCGTVFKLDRNGTETILHRFEGGVDGALPSAGLVADGAGNFYGATELGGSGMTCGSAMTGCGTIYQITP
jgi:uncharacterized repeat protein (TIGR03803 family)